MASGRDWRADEVPTAQLPDLTEVATGRLPDPPGGEQNLAGSKDGIARVLQSAPLVTVPARQKSVRRAPARLPRSISKRDAAQLRAIQEQCRKLCLALFFREPIAIRSLGFTSAVAGEGKTFLSILAASVLAADTTEPVVLVECNWGHPDFHARFDIPPQPGLAEWLRGECSEAEIRHRVGPSLIVIPAGDGPRDAVRLLQRLTEKSAAGVFINRPERYIFDLPPVISTAYGDLASGVPESLVLVVRAGATPDTLVAQACEQLNDHPIEGILLNRVESQIPKWIQRML